MSIEAIERVLRAADGSGVASGFVAAARLPGGGEYHGAFGRRGVADPAAMTEDTLFWIASMTKLVTAIGALQLVEQGRLSLDQPASDFMPTIANIPILDGFDAAGAPRLRAAARPVTLRHLLTHTSGFGYTFFNADLSRYAEREGLGAEQALTLPRLFEAGERWQYGVGIDYVGQIIEAITGQGLDAYLKQAVFDVLGMADTGFAPTPDQAKRQAAMHARLPDGSLSPFPFAPAPPPNPMLGGGGLYSTAVDYLKLLDALLGGGAGPRGRILKSESMALLTDSQVGDIQCGALTSSMAMLSNDFEPNAGQPKRWSLGLMIDQAAGPDGRGAGALSWAGLTNCYYWLDPAAGAAGVILTQILPFADPKVLGLLSAFERSVYA